MSPVTIEPYPFGKRFSIVLVDDTDGATLQSIKPIYEYLYSYGILSTKTVWPLRPTAPSGEYEYSNNFSCDTLEDREYRKFCEKLNDRGFEIAMHTASSGNSKREETIRAYDYFQDIFGCSPATNIMHGRNKENIYWGKYCVHDKLMSGLISIIEPQEFLGHVEDSEYYWGDICRERTRYVRLFDTLSSNTLKFDPATPFHDLLKKDVKWWFSSSYGAGTRIFKLLSRRNIDALREKRGASIIHSYLRHYVLPGPRAEYIIHPEFKALLKSLAEYEDGYYVPVYILLDRLRAIRSLTLSVSGREIIIRNNLADDIANLAINVPDENFSLSSDTSVLNKNKYGQINIGTLKGAQSVVLLANKKNIRIINPIKRREPNYRHLFWGHVNRVRWQFQNGRRRINECHDPPWVTQLTQNSSQIETS